VVSPGRAADGGGGRGVLLVCLSVCPFLYVSLNGDCPSAVLPAKRVVRSDEQKLARAVSCV